MIMIFFNIKNLQVKNFGMQVSLEDSLYWRRLMSFNETLIQTPKPPVVL